MQKYTYGVLKNLIIPKPVRNKKGETWDDNIFTFDIETSSAWYTPEHKLIEYDFNYGNDFYKQCVPFSLCYIWQFGINDTVLYGRELNMFYELLLELSELIDGAQIWVHNLAYEFQFLLNFIEFDKIFARSPHKVIYADWHHIRFRCSYFLTRLSLEAWGIQTGVHQKKTGQLDYLVNRTPLTELTDDELDYCENDILVMYAGLLKYRDKYENVHNIPLTQTGEIRRVVKDMYKNDMDYHRKMTELLPRNADEYRFIKQAFQGGYTHANAPHVGRVINNVHSCDISSSYPTVMCSEKFPMGRWFFVRPYEFSKYYNADYSLIVDVTFTNIKAKSSITYISTSKLLGNKTLFKNNGEVHTVVNGHVVYGDNGRVIRSKEIRMVCTNIDLDIINMFYNFTDIKFNKIYASKNEYLDEKLVAYTLELYNNKTTLKNVVGKEDLYTQSKQFLNSLYGMCVTDIAQDDVSFISEEWHVLETDINQALDELRCKPYKNFLAYQHGVFITAYARRNLMQVVAQMPSDVIYCDTDSIKYVGNHDILFQEYNENITEKLKKCLNWYNLDESLICPYAPNGEQQHLGHYEKEKDYTGFITQGAKRYAYTYDNELKDIHITVSGVNKKQGGKALARLEDFKENFYSNIDIVRKQ